MQIKLIIHHSLFTNLSAISLRQAVRQQNTISTIRKVLKNYLVAENHKKHV